MISSVPNILTFDVEDWPQSTLDPALPITSRVRDNTCRILDLLGGAGVRATFFVLGLVAELFPALLRRVRDEGHELATHGYSHLPVYAMGMEEFRADLRRSVALIESAAGAKVLGYRAPDFSIPEDALWSLEILAEEGLAYDSSIFPFSGPRYGLRSAFRAPWRVRCVANPKFVELPLTTLGCLGLRIPAAGGGYFRLFPYPIARAAIASLNRTGSPATTYLHPYEIDTGEMASLTRPIPLRLRISQGLLRGSVERKLHRLLHDFSWGPARDWLEHQAALTGERVLDLTGLPHGSPRWLPGTSS
jgi:polysaccharide deacetylase family protein (PEP-CTERM system associated)